MASDSQCTLACQRYVRFLFRSYLKWERLQDVCDVSSLVRSHQPTIVSGQSYYPADFISILRTQILLQLEIEYGCSASGWLPEVECKIAPEAEGLSLKIWFTQTPKKQEKPPTQRK